MASRSRWLPATAAAALLVVVAVRCGAIDDGQRTAEVAGAAASAEPPASSAPSTSAPSAGAPPGTLPSSAGPTRTSVEPDPLPLDPVDAEQLLDRLVVAPERAGTPYERDGWPHWSTQPDGCSTRERVLIDESRTPAQVDPFGCRVLAGDWFSTYDGEVTEDPGDLDVDHVVALAEAHRSGGWAWDEARREAFANDLGFDGSLVAVSAASNRSKGDRDPAGWQPSRRAAWCSYATDWIAVKVRWGLTADPAEVDALANLLRTCEATSTSPTVTPAPTPTPSPPAPAPVAPAPSPGGPCHPSYPTICVPPAPPDLDCGDIPQWGGFPVVGDDPHGFDGNDQDGLGCEGNA